MTCYDFTLHATHGLCTDDDNTRDDDYDSTDNTTSGNVVIKEMMIENLMNSCAFELSKIS